MSSWLRWGIYIPEQKFLDSAVSIKRRSAKEAASPRSHKGYWIDHAQIVESDYEWLSSTERLTLWNVKLPPDFLAQLKSLWWLDLRGGSATDLAVADGAVRLKYLAVNQVRGMSDLSALSQFSELRFLDLYGLPKVTELPSLESLSKVERVQMGQMSGLRSIGSVLDAPNLRELQFVKRVNLTPDDVDHITSHPAIKTFDWFAEDIPKRDWQPVVEKVNLPRGETVYPEEWFGLAK